MDNFSPASGAPASAKGNGVRETVTGATASGKLSIACEIVGGASLMDNFSPALWRGRVGQGQWRA